MAELLHAPVTDVILSCFYAAGNEMGHGFLESAHQNVRERSGASSEVRAERSEPGGVQGTPPPKMYIALTERGVRVRKGVRLPVRFRGRIVGAFEADLLVEDVVVVEIKAGRAIDPSAVAQTMNYLRASDLEVGLVLNFGPKLEFQRVVFTNSRKSRGTAAQSGERS